jgi:S-adenosylmethionine synthetase
LELIKESFELRPAGIIHTLNLKNLPSERGGRFYQDIAAYGHFGRDDLDLPWERTDKADALRVAASKLQAAALAATPGSIASVAASLGSTV